jgi:hypothetical protein
MVCPNKNNIFFSSLNYHHGSIYHWNLGGENSTGARNKGFAIPRMAGVENVTPGRLGSLPGKIEIFWVTIAKEIVVRI